MSFTFRRREPVIFARRHEFDATGQLNQSMPPPMLLPPLSLGRINGLGHSSLRKKLVSLDKLKRDTLLDDFKVVDVLPSPKPSDVVAFEEFEANLRTRELLRSGTRLRLPDQSFQLLTMLLQCPGELVSRVDIQRALWPSDTFVDFDHGLNNAMNRLRDVLGDSADSPRFIETLPRRGYRFIASLKKADDGGGPTVVALPAGGLTRPESTNHGSRRLIWASLALAFTCAVVALAIYFFSGIRSSAISSGATASGLVLHSIAVLPLDNLTADDPEEEYFVDGMTEALIANLAKIKSLQVASRSSVLRYKGKKKSMREIARELGVDAVVEGAVVYANSRIRIDVRLIQTSTNRHLWAENYDREWTNALEVQNEVASDIARQIEASFASQQQASRAAPQGNAEAASRPEDAASE